MLDSDIVWVSLIYNDSSQSIFRATKNREIIESILGRKETRDVFDGEVLKEGYLFKVNTMVLFEVINVRSIEVSREMPEFEREVDKFANSFI